MYSKKEFMNFAAEQIKKTLPKEVADKLTIEQTTVIKVNDQELHGLVFKREDDKASPTIYLDQMYERYKRGEEPLAMIGDMAQQYLDSLMEHPGAIQPDLSYDKIKDHVTLRLVELKRNRMYLVNVPYMTEKLPGSGEDKYVLQMDAPIIAEDKSNMYVLSNESGVLGASTLFYPGVQETIAEKLGESYYALPSSLHEMIIVPESAGINKADLGEMVRSANENVVDAKDVLSDNVFRYDREEKQLTTSAHPMSLGIRQEEARC